MLENDCETVDTLENLILRKKYFDKYNIYRINN